MKKSKNLNSKKINSSKQAKKESKAQPVEKTVKNKPKTNDNNKLINNFNNKNDNLSYIAYLGEFFLLKFSRYTSCNI